jgi:hypothetical protein
LIQTNNGFFEEVEKLCASKNIDYIDAVVHICEKNKIDIEHIAVLIKKNPNLKFKIQTEAENLNFLKKGARLPI